MQVRYHPDRQYGSDSEQQFAAEMSRLVNDAMNVTRQAEAARAAKIRREEAYAAMKTAVAKGASGDELRAAIDIARAAGVSEQEIEKAAAVLRRLG